MAKAKVPKTRDILAENVRIERARRQFSQEALAGRAGVSRVYLGTIERGEVSCSIDVVDKIAAALEVSVTDLLSPLRRK